MDYIYDVERLWDQTGETRVLKRGGEGEGGLWEVATLNLPWVLGKVTIATKK